MDQSPRLEGRVDLGAGPARTRAGSSMNDECDTRSLHMDWDVARITKANLLLIGAEHLVSNLVFSLWSSFSGPVVVRRQDERLQLPLASAAVGTVVLHRVDTLTGDEQTELYDWLSVTKGRTRIVSTVCTSLMPMIEARAFSDRLYYRLNALCVDLRLTP